MYPSSATPISLPALLMLAAAYLLLGLPHELWKADDAEHIAVAWDIAQRGHWLTPQLAGTPWDDAPLWYWVAALFGKLLGGLIGFHQAARLATALFGALFLYAAARATAALAPRDTYASNAPVVGRITPLLLIGSLGLLIPIHEAQPMIAVLAAHALVYWGVATLRQPGLLPALRLGGGLSISLLAGGMPATVPLLAVLVSPLLLAGGRRRETLLPWALALVTAALVAGAAHLLGMLHHPRLDKHLPTLAHFELLAWFAWPTLPLALWALWLNRRQWRAPHVFMPLLGTLGGLPVFVLHQDAHVLPALPLLLPLALLAATGAGRLRRGAANAFDWFGKMSFTLAAALVWLGAVAMLFGVPARLQFNLLRHTPGFTPEFNLWGWALAAIVTLLWLGSILHSRRSAWRATLHWSAGVTLMWTMLACLWMPWIEHRKSYAPALQKIAAATPDQACVLGRGLSDTHRALLDYYAGIQTRRSGDCSWLITTANRQPPAAEGWRSVLEVSRPGEKQERFYLYQRK